MRLLGHRQDASGGLVFLNALDSGSGVVRQVGLRRALGLLEQLGGVLGLVALPERDVVGRLLLEVQRVHAAQVVGARDFRLRLAVRRQERHLALAIRQRAQALVLPLDGEQVALAEARLRAQLVRRHRPQVQRGQHRTALRGRGVAERNERVLRHRLVVRVRVRHRRLVPRVPFPHRAGRLRQTWVGR